MEMAVRVCLRWTGDDSGQKIGCNPGKVGKQTEREASRNRPFHQPLALRPSQSSTLLPLCITAILHLT